jgi:hypothetical protein
MSLGKALFDVIQRIRLNFFIFSHIDGYYHFFLPFFEEVIESGRGYTFDEPSLPVYRLIAFFKNPILEFYYMKLKTSKPFNFYRILILNFIFFLIF